MSKSFLAKSLICSAVALVTVGATVGSASAQYGTHDFGFLADLPTIGIGQSPCGTEEMWDDVGNIPIAPDVCLAPASAYTKPHGD